MSSIKHINTHKEFPWRSPALFKYVILLSALLINFCWSQLHKAPDLRRFQQLLQIVIVIWIIQISDYSSCDSPNYFFFLQETMLCSQVEGDDRKWHICSWWRGWRRWIRQCLCNSHPNGSKELPGIAFWFFEKDYVGLFPFILVWMCDVSWQCCSVYSTFLFSDHRVDFLWWRTWFKFLLCQTFRMLWMNHLVVMMKLVKCYTSPKSQRLLGWILRE